MENSDEHPLLSKNKLYYSIGEVKEITQVEQHVLRYWESEFSSFKPKKSRSGHRAYTKKDIEMALVIKDLLYDKKFTIKGAKLKLKERELHKGDLENASSEKEKKDQEEKEDASSQQLVFGEIEQKAEIQLLDRDYLVHLKDKLREIYLNLPKMD